MSYSGLESFVQQLVEKEQLIVIDDFVNPELEITEIADRFSKSPEGGKALLFKNTGTDFPLLINAFGNKQRINLALGVEHDSEFASRIDELLQTVKAQPETFIQKVQMLPKLAGLASFLPKKMKGKGACQQIVDRTPDLNKLPILKCWPFDGGKFITLPIVHTIDPDTGMRNVGMYRMQQLSANTTGMHWHKHKVGARHYRAYQEKREKMPVSVVLGGDPAYTYAATAPAPDHFDEYILAGFIRQKSVELVKCITNDIFVPADADIVIEGYVDTEEDMVVEGPFGDHTGFYSLADKYPKFHVTCITHRKNAIYPATIVGVPPMEDALMGEISEKIFLKPLQIGIAPEVNDMHMPVAGVVHNMVIVSADIQYQGQVFKIANALWGAGQMMFTKYIIVVDKHIDVRNYGEVFSCFENNVDFQADLLFSRGPLDILDHTSAEQAVGGKLCIDATKKHRKSIMEPSESGVLDKPNVRQFGEKLFFVFSDDIHENSEIAQAKMRVSKGVIVCVEEELLDLNLFTLVWYVLGNTDPVRDIQLDNQTLFVDARRKHKREGFARAWPDLVVMDNETIQKVDEKWNEWPLGEFLSSPSKLLKRIANEKGAELL